MKDSFYKKLSFDEPNNKFLNEKRLDISGFTLFKRTFFGQLWNMVKTNWLMLVFCLPVIIWGVIGNSYLNAINQTVPYSANIGGINTPVNYAYEMGQIESMKLAMQNAVIMMPMIIIATVGLAGVFNVVKYFCLGMPIKIVRNFFVGIKNSFTPFVWMGTMLGLCYVFLTFGVYMYGVPLAAKITVIVIASFVSLFVLMLCVFVFTQAVIFNLSVWQLIKNSLLLGTKFILQNILILIAGLASMSLGVIMVVISNQNMFLMILQMLALMLFFMLSFTWTATTWTIYSHFVSDMLYMQNKKDEEKAALVNEKPNQQKKKASKPQYRNPKKSRKG